jgi:DNA-binding GntR family transcriptional regulator
LPLVGDGLRLAFDHWERIRRHFFRSVPGPRLAEAQREHRAIVAAVRRGSTASLESALRRHNRHARRAYIRALAVPSAKTRPAGALA